MTTWIWRGNRWFMLRRVCQRTPTRGKVVEDERVSLRLLQSLRKQASETNAKQLSPSAYCRPTRGSAFASIVSMMHKARPIGYLLRTVQNTSGSPGICIGTPENVALNADRCLSRVCFSAPSRHSCRFSARIKQELAYRPAYTASSQTYARLLEVFSLDAECPQ